jgi:hypothetical protein
MHFLKVLRSLLLHDAICNIYISCNNHLKLDIRECLMALDPYWCIKCSVTVDGIHFVLMNHKSCSAQGLYAIW